MKITDLSVRRPVTISMVVLCVILLGVVSLTRLSLDLFPEINLPVAVVVSDYPGAGPQEVETAVTRPLEEILGTVQNVYNIESTTGSGSSTVIVWFNWGTDMDYATLQMREKVDLIKGFLPEDVSDPMVIKMDPSMMPVVQMGMSGGRDMAELKSIAEDVVKPKLERLKGVASVTITGGYNREIQIIADPVKMAAYGVGLSQIENALKMENMNLSSGQVTDGKKELFVHTMGEYTSLDDIRRVHITLPSGGSVFLKDIAEIKDTFSEQNQITRMNGKPTVGIHVSKQSKANTVSVSAEVNRELEKLVQQIPGEIEINTVFDQATYINQSIGTVAKNAVLGGVLSILILFIFLRNIRSTLVIGISIPIAIIGTFTLLYLNGLTLNMLSLGGLALGLGMMVDSSIVILENIYRYREEGHNNIDAAIHGSNEVAMAVTASTLTTVAVFLPIVFVEGIASQLFRELALTVSFSLLASLFVALTLVPMLSSKLLKVNGKNGQQAASKNVFKKASVKMGDFLNWLDGKYGKVLSWALGRRKTVVVGVFIALVASFALMPLIGVEFMPVMDGGQLAINVELDKGIILEETNKVTEIIESELSEIEEVDTVFASVGASGFQMGGQTGTPEVAQIMVMLVPLSERQRSSMQVADELRERLKGIPGADIEVSVMDSGMSTGAPVSIKVKGDELDQLKELANEIVSIV
ncbi:MAG: efflux RND transporter permease subunit, partial [Clostridia bacterium]|nr:efflux RND transporter permease subunit [Clostridia bacterium]